MDVTPELSPIDAAHYQSMIGVLRWIVESNRVDSAIETSAMASMMILPREGHLQQLYRMFAFLRRKHNDVVVFDHSEPDLEEPAIQDPYSRWT